VVERHGPEPEGTSLHQPQAGAQRNFQEHRGFSVHGTQQSWHHLQEPPPGGATGSDAGKTNQQNRLLDAHSTTVADGVIVMSAYLAKGLEFDQVIVSEADSDNYADHMDRNLLYVACTRAMHRLTLIHVGSVSAFIQ